MTEGVALKINSFPTIPVAVGTRVFVGRNVAVGGIAVKVAVEVRVCVGSGDD